MKRRSFKLPALPRIAFIVEGDESKWLVEALARKVVTRLCLKEQPCFETVRLFGSPQVMGLLSIVRLLLGRDYQRVIVVFDTHTANNRRISELLREIQAPLLKGAVSGWVSLVPVVPSIERWVLADEEALVRAAGKPLPEEALARGKSHPEEVLRELLGGWGPKEQKRVARYLDPERIRARDASFDTFARALEDALGRRPEATGPTAGSAP